MGSLIAFAPLLLASSPVADRCLEIPGWDQVIADEKVRWIIVGEFHGNNESPEIFSDAVCLTARSRRVVVAVEQPESDQGAIDSYLASDGKGAAKRAFLAAPFWNYPLKDGRSSEAYFRLFESLREMRASGKIVAVVAFKPVRFEAPPSPAAYERAMAQLLIKAGHSGATVVALVGNVHAMRTEVAFSTRYMPMAGHLPAEATLSFSIAGRGGESWACLGQPVVCGATPVPSREKDRTRGVVLSADERSTYSGTIVLGVPTTASPPQISSATQRR